MAIRRPIHALLLLLALCACAPATVRAHEGWGIVVDANGNVYFSDIPTNTIWRLTPDRRFEAVVRDKHSHALVLAVDGSIHGTHHPPDEPVRSVWRLAPDGQLTAVVPPTRDFPLGLQSFAMDAKGNIFSQNAYRAGATEVVLLRRDPAGEISVLAGSEAQFTQIDGMAFGPDSALYVTDGPNVRRIAADGTVATLNAQPLTTPRWDQDLMGVAMAEDGSAWIADYSGRRLIELLPNGGIGRAHHTRGILWAPTGVTLHSGDIYLLEHLRMPLVIFGDVQIGPYARISKMSAEGAVQHLVTLWGTNTWWAASVALALILVSVALLRRRMASRRRTARTR